MASKSVYEDGTEEGVFVGVFVVLVWVVDGEVKEGSLWWVGG